MRLKQISVFLENRAGRLAEVTTLIGDSGINIRALALADTSDFGILRILVDKPDEAYKILHDNGFAATETEVIAVEIPDIPGGLASILTPLQEIDVNVEYMYAFLEKATDKAIVVFRFEDVGKAIEALQANGVTVLESAQVYNL